MKKTYLIIFGWLIFLTVIEIGAASFAANRMALIGILLGCAAGKALLIALYFMHLRFDSPWVLLLPAIPLLLAIFFVVMLFPDIVYQLPFKAWEIKEL